MFKLKAFSDLLKKLGYPEYEVEKHENSEVFDPDVVVNVPEYTPTLKYFNDVPYSWHHHILNYEGGYANHPNDKGGETNLGITIGTLSRAKQRGIVPASITIMELSKHPKIVYDIYNIMYYKDPLCDKIPAMLSFAFHDACVNHGRGGRNSRGNPIGAGMLMQSVLIETFNKDIAFDGIVGKNSLHALDEVLAVTDVDKVTELFNDRREKYFKGIVASNPSQRVFLNGWLNRLNKVRDMCRRKVM